MRMGVVQRLVPVAMAVTHGRRLPGVLVAMVAVIVAMLVLVFQGLVRVPVRMPVQGEQRDCADEQRGGHPMHDLKCLAEKHH